jgi:hypothetical protein
VVEKRPWYEPSNELPSQPIITTTMDGDFDTVVVEGAAPNASVHTSLSERAHNGGMPQGRSDGHGQDQAQEKHSVNRRQDDRRVTAKDA